MEPPTPQARKRGGFTGSSSMDSEVEVIEILPTKNQRSKLNSNMDSEVEVIEIVPTKNQRSKLKSKEVLRHEVIELDLTDEQSDVIVIEKVCGSFKGKRVVNFPDSSSNGQGKETLVHHTSVPTGVQNIGLGNGFQTSKSFAPVSHSSSVDDSPYGVSFDNDEYTESYADDVTDAMDVDEYAMWQSIFDKADIPPGVEAPLPWLFDPPEKQKLLRKLISSPHSSSQPLPNAVGSTHGFDPSFSWFPSDSHQMKMNDFSSSGSSSKMQIEGNSHHPPPPPSAFSPWSYSEAGQSKQKATALSPPAYATLKIQNDGVSSTSGDEPSNSWRFKKFPLKKKPTAPSSSIDQLHNFRKKREALKFPIGVEPLSGSVPFKVNKLFGKTNSVNSSIPTMVNGVDFLPSELGPSMYWGPNMFDFGSVHTFPEGEYIPLTQDSQPISSPLTQDSQPGSSREKDLNVDEILKKFQLFKQFDTVDDYSDHHYARNGSSVNQPPKGWAKAIQEEWRMLEKDLPDMIFVRVYETRMDLLRAVIIGAEGTPYHDGLFFFDVFFPCGYPMEPPHVYYHSGGLRLNPNLYETGKVCLSLLNTWTGSKNEKWMPGVSTMLQVLVSIQALILNAQPYFNEPGHERTKGLERGEKQSEHYSEETLTKSLKTMLYTMRRPPKHFEDFVMGHFCDRAHDVLMACKAYMDGAQVGSLIKGVQDVDQGNKSCSMNFKANVAVLNNILMQAFTENGAKECEKFQVTEQDVERYKQEGRKLTSAFKHHAATYITKSLGMAKF